MSKEKKKKVIQVDELVIHANEVTVISPQTKDVIGSVKPWRPNAIENLDEKHESSSVKDELAGDKHKIEREEGAQRRVRPWWV